MSNKVFVTNKDAKSFYKALTANGAGDCSFVYLTSAGFWCKTIVRSEELGLTIVKGQMRDGFMRWPAEFVFDNEVIDEDK